MLLTRSLLWILLGRKTFGGFCWLFQGLHKISLWWKSRREQDVSSSSSSKENYKEETLGKVQFLVRKVSGKVDLQDVFLTRIALRFLMVLFFSVFFFSFFWLEFLFVTRFSILDDCTFPRSWLEYGSMHSTLFSKSNVFLSVRCRQEMDARANHPSPHGY